MTSWRTAEGPHGVRLRINKPPTDEQALSSLETRLGVRLPEAYRTFLLDFNGGRPDPSAFRFATRGGTYSDSVVNWFYSLHDGPASNLDATRETYRERMPAELLPIGDDPFDNQVCIGLAGDVLGKIFFWDHERELESQGGWSNIDLIADSFDAFLWGLTPSD